MKKIFNCNPNDLNGRKNLVNIAVPTIITVISAVAFSALGFLTAVLISVLNPNFVKNLFNSIKPLKELAKNAVGSKIVFISFITVTSGLVGGAGGFIVSIVVVIFRNYKRKEKNEIEKNKKQTEIEVEENEKMEVKIFTEKIFDTVKEKVTSEDAKLKIKIGNIVEKIFKKLEKRPRLEEEKNLEKEEIEKINKENKNVYKLISYRKKRFVFSDAENAQDSENVFMSLMTYGFFQSDKEEYKNLKNLYISSYDNTRMPDFYNFKITIKDMLLKPSIETIYYQSNDYRENVLEIQKLKEFKTKSDEEYFGNFKVEEILDDDENKKTIIIFKNDQQRIIRIFFIENHSKENLFIKKVLERKNKK